jgi:hypothetical protein
MPFLISKFLKLINVHVEIAGYFQGDIIRERRSQWPRGLWHELLSLARTLGSWVRVPLKGRMSVYVYLVFVAMCRWRPCVGADPPSEETYRLSKKERKKETEVKRSVSRMSYVPSGSNRNR